MGLYMIILNYWVISGYILYILTAHFPVVYHIQLYQQTNMSISIDNAIHYQHHIAPYIFQQSPGYPNDSPIRLSSS